MKTKNAFLARVGWALAAPAVAIVVGVVVTGLALLISGNSPFTAYGAMLRAAGRQRTIIDIVNRSTEFYVAGLAVAIGFKMNLFNIGVEGQYRVAAVVAAAAGAQVHWWPWIHVPFILIVAMATGAAWAAIPAVLRVKRGVSEVISTIMLNSIAAGVIAYMLNNYFRDTSKKNALIAATTDIPKSGRMPPLNRLFELFGLHPRYAIYGFLVIAIAAGVGYYLLVQRTRFGFDLRTSGLNPAAARNSGVDPNRMIMITMLISGACAGLIGMSTLLGSAYRYSDTFPAGLGFTGIAVALLGRNDPIGIGVGALVFAFLDRAADALDLQGIPREIVLIIQGVIILSAVVAYEVVRRARLAAAVKSAAEATDRLDRPPALAGAAT